MKNPQLENGYLKIANELAEQFAKLHLSGNEWCIFWVILRKTYGFNKKDDDISLTQFQELTGLSRPAVVKAISKLVAKNVLVSKKLSIIKNYSINKAFSNWTSSKTATSSIKRTRLVAKQQPKLVAKQQHTKDNKDTIKDILLRNSKTFGNPDINELSKHFLQVMAIPKEDCTQRQSRQYWNLLLKESKTGVAGVKWLIGLARADEFYSNNITSSKSLYYSRIKLITRQRGNRPKIAVFSGGNHE